MSDLWDPSVGYVDADQLDPLAEVLYRLRLHHAGDLEGFISPPARWEQGMEPIVLPPEDARLAEQLLALPAERIPVEAALRAVGAERARTVLRQVVREWNLPEAVQAAVSPYLQRRHGEVTWMLEKVDVGVTAVGIQFSVSGPVPGEVPDSMLYPNRDPEAPPLARWWGESESATYPRLSDDVGTQYEARSSEWIPTFPLRVLVGGDEQTRMTERYTVIFAPGLPLTARNLSLSGTITLTIDPPSTEPRPQPAEVVSLGDFSYTIDVQGWWPEAAKDREEYLVEDALDGE